jgi:hypothetical protein
VTVIGASGRLDATSATVARNLESSTLASLPVGRRFSDTLYLAPGVSDTLYLAPGVSSLGVRPFSVPAQPFLLRQPTANSPSDFRLTGGRRAWSTPIRSTHADAGRRTATVVPRPEFQSAFELCSLCARARSPFACVHSPERGLCSSGRATAQQQCDVGRLDPSSRSCRARLLHCTRTSTNELDKLQ